MPQQYLDELLAFASRESLKSDLLKAKAEFFEGTGEVREDERAFEQRMAMMLNYFLFDRPMTGTAKTPTQLYVEEQARARSADDLGRLSAFTRTYQSLFEVRKFLDRGVRLRDVFSGRDSDASERRRLPGLSKGDLVDARLVPFQGENLFCSAFCFHPREARQLILKEIKRLKKDEPAALGRPFLWKLCKMALKVERYRNVAVVNIYRFDGGGL